MGALPSYARAPSVIAGVNPVGVHGLRDARCRFRGTRSIVVSTRGDDRTIKPTITPLHDPSRVRLPETRHQATGGNFARKAATRVARSASTLSTSWSRSSARTAVAATTTGIRLFDRRRTAVLSALTTVIRSLAFVNRRALVAHRSSQYCRMPGSLSCGM